MTINRSSRLLIRIKFNWKSFFAAFPENLFDAYDKCAGGAVRAVEGKLIEDRRL